MARAFLPLAALTLAGCGNEDIITDDIEVDDRLSMTTATYSGGPGRCRSFDASYSIAAGESQREVMPYLDCLGSAEKRYGFNDGPFAVEQCKEVRGDVLSGFADSKRDNIDFLLTEIDREQVWLSWCDTDVGSRLPDNIEIRPDWPQAQSKMQ